MLLHSSAEERSISTFFLRTILCNMSIFHRRSIYIHYTNIDEYINCYLLLLTKLYTLYSDNTLIIHCYIYSICADILLQGTIYCTFRCNPLVLKRPLLHMLTRIAYVSILSASCIIAIQVLHINKYMFVVRKSSIRLFCCTKSCSYSLKH